MRSCLFQSHFSNRFLHKVYCTYIFHTSNNFTDHKMLIYNFFLQLHSTISSFCKRIYYVHLCVILFLFLSKTEVQATNKSCLSGFERLQNQTHLLRFETKLSQIFFFFYFFQNYILLSNYIRESVYLKTVWSCHFVSSLPLTELESIFPLKDLCREITAEKTNNNRKMY